MISKPLWVLPVEIGPGLKPAAGAGTARWGQGAANWWDISSWVKQYDKIIFLFILHMGPLVPDKYAMIH